MCPISFSVRRVLDTNTLTTEVFVLPRTQLKWQNNAKNLYYLVVPNSIFLKKIPTVAYRLYVNVSFLDYWICSISDQEQVPGQIEKTSRVIFTILAPSNSNQRNKFYIDYKLEQDRNIKVMFTDKLIIQGLGILGCLYKR